MTGLISPKLKWVSKRFWKMSEVMDFLDDLTPAQAMGAKVIHTEQKFEVVYLAD